jgi:hypothetical protein
MSCCGNKKKTPFTQYSIVKAGESIIKHYTDPNYNAFSSQEEKDRRVEICNFCENLELFLTKKRCKVCLCFIEAKASLIEQTCPHPQGDRWLKEGSQ